MRTRIAVVVSGSALALALATGALLLAAPGPGDLAAIGHRTLAGTADPDAAIAALAALAAWGVVTWLSVGIALSALARLPGLLGRCTGALAGWVLPATLRRLAELALGVTVATGTLSSIGGFAALPAAAAAAPPPAPTAPATVVVPDLDWPAGPTVTAPLQPAAVVVVRHGDSLWRIAARALGPGATDAQIAVEWPRWYAANRAVIGPDPDLLFPGQRLVPPAPPPR